MIVCIDNKDFHGIRSLEWVAPVKVAQVVLVGLDPVQAVPVAQAVRVGLDLVLEALGGQEWDLHKDHLEGAGAFNYHHLHRIRHNN